MLIALPKVTNWLTIEMDGTIWAARYDPIENTNTTGKLIGKISQINFPIKEKLNPQVDKHTRFINDKLEIVTINNLPYKTIIMEAILKGET